MLKAAQAETESELLNAQVSWQQRADSIFDFFSDEAGEAPSWWS